MFRFQYISDLHFLWSIPLIVLLFLALMHWKRAMIKKFGESFIILKLIPDFSVGRLWLKMLLLIFGIAALIIGLANPQIGSTLEKRERKGVDIIIALDVSNSMLSQDIKPNRLEKARQSIGRIIDQLDNDRLGIIVFAGKAYPMLPITHDHVAAKMFLSNINTDIVPTQGTSIADAIDLAIRSFPEGEHGKALVLITDGEDHQGDVLEKVKEAETKGIVIHTIGMGSQQGAPIPLYSGANQVGFRKTRDGQTIITRINEPMLQQIATAGRGIYVRASNSQAGLQRIHDEIYKMQKTEFDSQVFSDYDSRYYYFLMLAFIFLLIELFVFERSRRWSRNLKYFLPFLVLALTQPAYSQSEPALVRRGNKQYDKGNFKDSEVNYRKALEKDPRSFRGTYNLGNSTYRQENYEEALNTYQQSSLYKADDMQLAKAYHNLGNTMLKAKKLPEGIEAYKQSLRLNPMDDDTRYNLAYAMKLLDQQQQQSGDDKNDKTEKKDDQKDDKKNQDQKDQEQNPTEQQQSEARQPRQISKQEAERMLQAMKEEEQKTLDKVKQQRLKGQRVTIEKDW